MVKDSVHTTTGSNGRTVRHVPHSVAADCHRIRRRWRIMGVLRRRTWGEKEDQQQSDHAVDGLSFHAYESKIMGAKIGRALFAAIGVAVAASEVWPGTRCNSTSSCTKHTSPASAEACAVQTNTRSASHSGPDKQRNSGANKRLQQTVNRREFDERMRYPYSYRISLIACCNGQQVLRNTCGTPANVKANSGGLAGVPANAKANAARLAGVPANVKANAARLAGVPANIKANAARLAGHPANAQKFFEALATVL